jgi:hypothetical protein
LVAGLHGDLFKEITVQVLDLRLVPLLPILQVITQSTANLVSGSGWTNPETTGRGATSAENADCPCPARLRIPWLSNQAREDTA